MPVIIVSCSGGARMMEGALSLMQMAKICAALARLDRARLPYISVLTDPTTGGVTASFAMLGDLNIAEPKALIGFAGPRVIEQTIRQKLPEGFQRSEFLLEHGMIDMVVDRREMKAIIAPRAALHAARPRRPPRAGVGAGARARPVSAPGRRGSAARLPRQPRAPRHQARPRQHPRPLRRARPSGARVPVRPRRRHQRQGIGDRDGRTRRCAPPATATGALHLAAPGATSRSASTSTARRSAPTTSTRRSPRVRDGRRSRCAPPA